MYEPAYGHFSGWPIFSVKCPYGFLFLRTFARHASLVCVIILYSMQFFGKSYTLNLQGRLMDLSVPKVMGILNVTPDSFFSSSRYMSEEGILRRVEQMLEEGADILDIGACSTRPGIELVSEQEELNRLRLALHIIRKRWPECPISVDTFRSKIAETVVGDYGVDMINDISGGDMDPEMFRTIAKMKVPYVLMHMQGANPAVMQQNPQYEDLMTEVCQYFARRVALLRELGVNDVVLDPGFGFGKTMEHNYELLRRVNEFDFFDLPLLVGVSRKSMIYKCLGVSPQESLNGTSVLHAMALMGGAHILRVHDVKEAVECVKIVHHCKTAGLCF